MLDILKALSETSVPTLLMGLGGILLLLAFVQKIGTQIELPEKRQRAAALTGVVLLGLGVLVTVAPHMGGLRTEPAPAPQQIATNPSSKTTDTAAKATEANANPVISVEALPENALGETKETTSVSDEALYTGALGGLLPDLSLLDPDLRHFDTETFDVDMRLKYTGKDVTAGRLLLNEANYVGLMVKYDSNCNFGFKPGQVRHAIFQVDHFDTPAQAKAFWNLPHDIDPTRLMRDETPLRGFDHWVSEKLVDCGSKSSNLHWRIIRVGNMMLHVGLFTSDRSINDPNIAALSEALILSMAEKIPGSGL